MPTIRQFFGFEEDPRTPEGWFSWQHLTYVTALVIAVSWRLILSGSIRLTNVIICFSCGRTARLFYLHESGRRESGAVYALCRGAVFRVSVPVPARVEVSGAQEQGSIVITKIP